MVVYTETVFSHVVRPRDALALSGNIVVLSVFYAFVGSMLSFVLYYLFDDYNPDEKLGLKWEKRSVFYQVGDVACEIAIIALVSFWLVFTINTSAPIFPVPQHLAAFVDTYTTGMFFMYSVFIFMSDLTSKMKYLFKTHLAHRFDTVFPEDGVFATLSANVASRST